MTILITGGAGFIGAELAKVYLGRGEKVVIFDQKIDGLSPAGAPDLTLIKGDITNLSEVLNAISRHAVDTIFHLAAILSAVAEENPWAAININGMGTYNILEAARLFGVRKVIFSSSMGVYTVAPETMVTEKTCQKPTLIYGVTKVFGELLGLYYHRKFSLDFRGIRLPQLIGPHVKTMGFGQYNALMIEAAIKGDPFAIWAPPETVLPLLYTKDAIRSLIELSDADPQNLATRVYNIGQIMPPPTAADVLAEVKKHFPWAAIDFRPDPAAAVGLATIPDIISGEEAEREWGWCVEFSLAEAIQDFIEAYNLPMTTSTGDIH